MSKLAACLFYQQQALNGGSDKTVWGFIETDGPCTPVYKGWQCACMSRREQKGVKHVMATNQQGRAVEKEVRVLAKGKRAM